MQARPATALGRVGLLALRSLGAPAPAASDVLRRFRPRSARTATRSSTRFMCRQRVDGFNYHSSWRDRGAASEQSGLLGLCLLSARPGFHWGSRSRLIATVGKRIFLQ